MPITTPGSLYADAEHFGHVYTALFEPAISAAGFSPIPPGADGSDLIHSHIVSTLRDADLVLCDLSTLNANVLFELGLRTALNKPVSLVYDGLQEFGVFDLRPIHHYIYDPDLRPWNIESQIEGLREHLAKSVARSAGKNTLWRTFEVGVEATLTPPGEADKYDVLLQEVEALNRRLDSIDQRQERSERIRQLIESMPREPGSISTLLGSWAALRPSQAPVAASRLQFTAPESPPPDRTDGDQSSAPEED